MAHELPDHLYFFTSAVRARDYLAGGYLRWVAPDLLEDPFELHAQTPLPFDINILLDSTIKLATSMIFAPETPKGDSPLIHAVRRWRSEERFASADEAYPVLRELLNKMVDYRVTQLRSEMHRWQHFARNERVLKLWEKAETLAVWEESGDRHRGVALRFRISDNSPLATARRVVYQAERPQLTTLREQLGAIMHNRNEPISERFRDHLLIRAHYRRNESEWRCLRSSTREVPTGDQARETWYDDIPFPVEDLTGIFMGVRMPAEDKTQIAEQIAQKYPQCQLIQALVAPTGYQLEFKKHRH